MIRVCLLEVDDMRQAVRIFAFKAYFRRTCASERRATRVGVPRLSKWGVRSAELGMLVPAGILLRNGNATESALEMNRQYLDEPILYRNG